MRVVFCIYNYVPEKMPLQPWLTVRIVAENLVKKGHTVHVVTDVEEPAYIDGVKPHTVKSLRGSNAAEVSTLMAILKPEAVVFLPTPLNIVTAKWLDSLDCRCIGFASYSFYTGREMLTAWLTIGLSELMPYLRHMLVPKVIWVRAMRRRLHVIIAQSVTTSSRLESMLGDRLPGLYVQPGIELEQWPLVNHSGSANDDFIRLLYLGSAIAIRGFYVALDALAKVKDERVRLRVLARGAGDEDLADVRAAVTRRKLEHRVEIEGGWIERKQLISEIHAADAVLQPFVLVPSELPVTAMEVIACGTPVIGSLIDGLPSTIGAAGTVTRQGSSAALAEAITNFSKSARLRTKWQDGCRQQREAMLGWDEVTDRWEAVLRG